MDGFSSNFALIKYSHAFIIRTKKGFSCFQFVTLNPNLNQHLPNMLKIDKKKTLSIKYLEGVYGSESKYLWIILPIYIKANA